MWIYSILNLDMMQKVVGYILLITRLKEWVREKLHHPEIGEN